MTKLVSDDVKRVLIVDDNSAVRRAISGFIEAEEGFEVCGEAVNGQDAIDKAGKLEPDLVILDLSMPVMNGLQAARVLSANNPQTPLILLTAHSNALMGSDAQDAGVSAVLSKMDDMRELISKARALLGCTTRSASQGS